MMQVKRLPPRFMEYSKEQITNWAESAYDAYFNKHENIDYIIKKVQNITVIVPVDFQNTGTIQGNSVMSNGLQQFLQLKHQLYLSPESVTWCFISNVGYLEKYNKIYGLTGTIGKELAKELLESIYKVSVFYSPPHIEKQLIEFPSELWESETEWKDTIWQQAAEEAEAGRCVLIIVDTIEYSEVIFDELSKFEDQGLQIKMYCRDDGELHKDYSSFDPNLGGEVKSGTVIVATNVAGRGTDIIPDEKVELWGGMHVIVGFLPENKRIEDQAFGRTARNGNKGTCQLIMNMEVLKYQIHKEIKDYTNIKKIRDEQHEHTQADLRFKYIKETREEDRLFSLFIDELSALKPTEDESKLYQERFGMFTVTQGIGLIS